MKTLPSIGSLLDRAFELYFKNIRTFISISLLYFVASIPFIIGTILAPGKDIEFLVANGLVSPIEKIGLALNGITTVVVLLVIWLLVTIGVIIASKRLLENKSADKKEVLAEGIRSGVNVILVTLYQFFLTMVPLIAIAPGGLLITLAVNRGVGLLSLVGVFLYFFGLIIAIAGILYIGVHLQFGQFLTILSKQGPVEALISSRNLVRGRLLATILRLIVPKAIIFTGFFISQLIAFVLLTILFFYLPFESTDAVSKIADIIAHLLRMALLVIWFPLFTVTDTILFNDLEDTRS